MSLPSTPQMRHAVYLLLLLVTGACVTFAEWAAGHSGVDRPGGDLPGGGVPSPKPQACHAACLSRPDCEAWAWHGAPCQPQPVCLLKRRVPPQQLAAPGCPVASGVRHAAVRGLAPLAWRAASLAVTRPEGWLRDQLWLMAQGLPGHLGRFWADVMDSVWIGGRSDNAGAGHERGPYWLNGMVPLGALLRNAEDAGPVAADVNAQVDARHLRFSRRGLAAQD